MKPITTDVSKAINLLSRRIGKRFYYNEDCNTVVLPSEMESLTTIIGALYTYHLENKDNPKDIGISMGELVKKSGKCGGTLRGILYQLCPTFLNLQSYGNTKVNSKRISRRFSLNENGIELAERMIKNSLTFAASKMEKKAREQKEQERMEKLENE